jgi:hypothetical protein
MKKIITLILVLFATSVFSQKKMVKIEGFQGNQIEVSDSLSERVIHKFVFYMERNPINYEKALRKIKAIEVIKADRYFVSDLKGGVIYLNSRLNDFPYTKEVVILHHLAVNNGMKTKNKTQAYVGHTAFNITDRNEELFKKQLKRNRPYETIVKKLIENSPLRSKL